jgi:hypothetical protein
MIGHEARTDREHCAGRRLLIIWTNGSRWRQGSEVGNHPTSPDGRLCVLPLQKLAKKRRSVLGGDVTDMILAEETVEQF